MSFALDTLEGMLHLSDSDKAVVEQAMPTFAKWLTELNKDWDVLSDLFTWLSKSKPVADRLIADGRQLGPIAIDVLNGGGSMFEMAGAMGAINDLKAVIAANPVLERALKSDYEKLTPLLEEIKADWPKVQPAVNIILEHMNQRVVTMSELGGHVLSRAAIAPPPERKEDREQDAAGSVAPTRTEHAAAGGLGAQAEVGWTRTETGGGSGAQAEAGRTETEEEVHGEEDEADGVYPEDESGDDGEEIEHGEEGEHDQAEQAKPHRRAPAQRKPSRPAHHRK